MSETTCPPPILSSSVPNSGDIKRKMTSWKRFAAFAALLGIVLFVLGWMLERRPQTEAERFEAHVDQLVHQNHPQQSHRPNRYEGIFTLGSWVFKVATGGPLGFLGSLSLLASVLAAWNVNARLRRQWRHTTARDDAQAEAPAIIGPGMSRLGPEHVYGGTDDRTRGPFTPAELQADLAESANVQSGFRSTKWKAWELVVLYALTLLFPISGIAMGAIGLCSPAKRSQGGVLMASALVIMMIWWGILSVA